MKIYKQSQTEESGTPQKLVWEFESDLQITHFVLSTLGDLMAIVVDHKELLIYDLTKEKRITKKIFKKFPLQEVKFCPKGKWIAVIQLGCKRVSLFHLEKEKKELVQSFSFFLLADDFFFTESRKEMFILLDGNLYHKKINQEGIIPIAVFIEQIQYLPQNTLLIASQNTLNFYKKINNYKKFKLLLLGSKVYLFKCQKQLLGISTIDNYKTFQLRNLQCQKMLRKFNQPFTIYDMHFTLNNTYLIINYGINITLLHIDTFKSQVIHTKEHIFEKVYLSSSNELFMMDSENKIKKVEIKM